MMKRSWPTVLIIAAVLATAAGTTAARDPAQATSPYQCELPFAPGRALDPEVVVAGIDWFLFSVTPLDELEPGREVSVEVNVGFRNTTNTNVEALVFLLFQDAEGQPLERVSLRPVRVRDGRDRTEDDRHEIAAAVLEQTSTLYVLCEIEVE